MPWRRALAALAVACCGACATAHNYLDPEGPRYVGGLGISSDTDPALRVVTFNVEYGKRVPEAIDALRTPPLRGADVVLLQEMHGPAADAIATALAMNYVYYPSSRHPATGRDFGNAVLSPWPIEASRKLLLPGRSRGIGQARAAARATVLVDGLAVTVYSVHLTSMWGMGESGRERQAEHLIADAGSCPGPVLIAGDFNSKALGARFESAGFSWPTRNAGRSTGPFSYDHIFVRGLRLLDEASVGVARNGPRASDHWPVWAVFVSE